MTHDERAKLRTLLEQATISACAKCEQCQDPRNSGAWQCMGLGDVYYPLSDLDVHDAKPDSCPHTWDFLLAARDALPALLDELDSKDRETARLTARCAALERMAHCCSRTCESCVYRDNPIRLVPCDRCYNWHEWPNWEFDEERFAAKEGKP